MSLSAVKTLFITFVCIALHANTFALSPESCGSSSAKSGHTLRVNGSDIVLRAGPNLKTEKLVNQKASQAFGRTEYLTIGPSFTVSEECTQGEWSRVKALEPAYLKDSHVGWVQSSSLRHIKKDSAGFTEFVDADFVWNKKTLPHKKTIIAGINKIHRENSRCKFIDPSSADISSSKGSSSDPVFYVTCGPSGNVFNVFFSKSEIDKGAAMAALKHIDRNRAIGLCESHAKSKASHPSTFSFSRVVDLAVNEYPNGRTAVSSSFTAKNSFNLEIKHNIRCLFDGNGLIEANISETK